MDRKKGILSMILASSSFAMMAAMVKLSGGAVPISQQLFLRNLMIGFLAYFTMREEHIPIAPRPESRRDLFFRSFFGLCGMVCFFYANRNLKLGDAQILQKTAPVFITLLSTVLLKEKLTIPKIFSLLLAFAGAVVIIKPDGHYTLFPFLVGLTGALMAGLAYSFLRRLRNENGFRIIFYFAVFSSIVLFPPMVYSYEPLSLKNWGILILIGVFAGSGQFFITRAYASAPASEVSIFDYAGVVVAPLVGAILFSERISLRMFLGMLLIIASGYISYYFNTRRKPDHPPL